MTFIIPLSATKLLLHFLLRKLVTKQFGKVCFAHHELHLKKSHLLNCTFLGNLIHPFHSPNICDKLFFDTKKHLIHLNKQFKIHLLMLNYIGKTSQSTKFVFSKPPIFKKNCKMLLLIICNCLLRSAKQSKDI